MRILIADDEFVGRETLKHQAKRFGECIAVENGRQAVDEFVRAWTEWRPFSLILLDIQMPEMDGTAVLAAIREMENSRNMDARFRAKVIMITSQSASDPSQGVYELQCDGFIEKPADRRTIEGKLLEFGLLTRPDV